MPTPTPAPALALRPFLPRDQAPLRSWITSETELVNWAGTAFTWPLDDTQLTAYAAEPDRATWTALTPDGPQGPHGHPLGHVSLYAGRLGRVLISPAARGRGLGGRLVSLALDHAFDTLGLPSVGLGVWAHNTAALRLYENLGFRVERTVPNAVEVAGTPWTAVEMRLSAPVARPGGQ
ncbi:GNAT family protein [Streptomyces sp. NPDC087917]|uniref:GNAT family N-acetyltransferase n=1 Tax=Streptomyces sp. NPDC087917 TaxID=3155060 RepID=UPI003439F1BF